MAKKTKYKIGEACRELDIQPYVLRYWETEFPQLSEGTSGSGQRTYSEGEMRIIKRIKELLYEEGYTIAGAKKKLEAEVSAGQPPEDSSEEQQELPVETTASDQAAPKSRPKKKAKTAKKTEAAKKAPVAKKTEAAAKTETARKTGAPGASPNANSGATEDADEQIAATDSVDDTDRQISKRLELIRSDLETLRDEARSVADRLREP